MSDIELIELPARHYVGIRREVNVQNLPEFFAEVFPAVMQWVAQMGITPASMPMAVWCHMDMESGIADTHAGVFVDGEVDVDGEITMGTTPAGEAFKLVHVGGYDKMGQSWMRVYKHAGEAGRAPGAGWEVYVDDPTTVPTEELKTEIYLPVT